MGSGLIAKAIDVEEQAMIIDPEKQEYYQEQINRFRTLTYAEELETGLTGDIPAAPVINEEVQGNASSRRT